MTLTANEYHDHLKTTAVRAGFSFADVVLPSEKTVPVGHLRFRYLDWGNEKLPALLFLHGGALTAHTWDLCCLALRDEYHCIALDQRGHGDSDWAEDADYSIGAQLHDTKGFVDKIGLDKFILVGMSLGAINSLAFAIAHPERLSALVIIDAGPEVRRPGSGWRNACPTENSSRCRAPATRCRATTRRTWSWSCAGFSAGLISRCGYPPLATGFAVLAHCATSIFSPSSLGPLASLRSVQR